MLLPDQSSQIRATDPEQHYNHSDELSPNQFSKLFDEVSTEENKLNCNYELNFRARHSLAGETRPLDDVQSSEE